MFIRELTEKDLGLAVAEGVDVSTVPTRVAVRGVIQDAEGKIAMTNIPSSWGLCLPGGGVDGQALEVALKREILEEVGADIDNIVPLGIVREYRLNMDNGDKPIINESIVFSAKVLGDLKPLQLTEDEKEWGHVLEWYTLDEAKGLLRQSLLKDDNSNGATFVLNRELIILEEYTKYLEQSSQQNPKMKDAEEIAKKAQYDYIMLKGEFDSYVRRIEADTKESKVTQLVELAKKMLPIVDHLGQSVTHIPEELQDNTWAAGVKLTYENAVKILQGLGIKQIATIGEEPDMEMHDPLSVEPTDDTSLKGKIIKEFQPGYVYEKDGIKKVIAAAKVIVGQ